jgi:hypothetical protein
MISIGSFLRVGYTTEFHPEEETHLSYATVVECRTQHYSSSLPNRGKGWQLNELDEMFKFEAQRCDHHRIGLLAKPIPPASYTEILSQKSTYDQERILGCESVHRHFSGTILFFRDREDSKMYIKLDQHAHHFRFSIDATEFSAQSLTCVAYIQTLIDLGLSKWMPAIKHPSPLVVHRPFKGSKPWAF